MCFVGLQAAAQCYIDLIIKESDNNVKLIVLDRLIELKEHPTHERVLQVRYRIRNAVGHTSLTKTNINLYLKQSVN